MADSGTQLHLLLARMRAGDEAARNELFRHATGRLERLTRKMLHQFPGVRRWAETDDVLQNALIRLLRTLEAVRPATPRDFLGLAAEAAGHPPGGRPTPGTPTATGLAAEAAGHPPGGRPTPGTPTATGPSRSGKTPPGRPPASRPRPAAIFSGRPMPSFVGSWL